MHDCKRELTEYERILRRAQGIRADMLAAYRRSDHQAAFAFARDLGTLYAPADPTLAGRIGYLVDCTAMEMWYGAKAGPVLTRMCPGGCGCRLGTEDADARECGCDGGCCE